MMRKLKKEAKKQTNAHTHTQKTKVQRKYGCKFVKCKKMDALVYVNVVEMKKYSV